MGWVRLGYAGLGLETYESGSSEVLDDDAPREVY